MDIRILSEMESYEHEQVVFCQNKEVGLKSIIAIHDTTLGPALGGTRMWNYASESEALYDVLRLSRGMTYKAAAAGLNLGGGKAVIIGDPKKDKSQALFRAYGMFVNSLGGRYITAEDVGTNVHDMECIFMETDYVTGTDPSRGGSGDPSPFTALGVFCGMKACLEKVTGEKSFKGIRIAIQGVGSVGRYLSRHLVHEGAEVVVTDIDDEKVSAVKDELKVDSVLPDEIYSVPCDIFAPCALGAILNDKTIDKLKCKIVAGGANNQLERMEHAEVLKKRGILYAPDYVINAGGLMNVYLELEGYSKAKAENMARGIYYNVKRVLKKAEELNITTARAADVVAEEAIKKMRHSSSIFQLERKSVLNKRRHLSK